MVRVTLDGQDIYGSERRAKSSERRRCQRAALLAACKTLSCGAA